MALAQRLPLSRLVVINVNLQPLAAQFASFSSLLIMGDSNAINVHDRIVGPFGQLADVEALFGGVAPEYEAAKLYLSQVPTPANIYFGRWASTPTHGILECGFIAPADLPMSNWTSITNGGFEIAVDGGAAVNIAGLNFSAQPSLNGVASVINASLASHTAGAGCMWNGAQFVFTSNSTGINSSIGFLTPPVGGGGVVDISTKLLGTAATAEMTVQGIAAETAETAVAILDGISAWYGLMVASTVALQVSDHVAIAGYIQGAGRTHIYGVTTQNATDVWNASDASDVASELSAAQYTRSFCIYSSYNPYAAAAVFGIAFSTNWATANAAYTLMYKICFGLTEESIGTAVASVMDKKRCMYFAGLDNNTAILQFGEMSGPAYFDEIHGTDALANAVQTNIFNVLYTSRKVPQTDPGEHLLVLAANVALSQFVTSGLIAPGQWNAAGVGAVSQGDFLSTGYYAYLPPVATQAQADREARKAMPMTILIKLAGACHTAFVQLLVER